MAGKNKNLFPLLLFIISITVQLGVLFYLFNPSAFFYKYWELALRLRGVISPSVEVFYSSPFYICFLAFSQGMGLNYLNIQILQVLLGAVNCWLIYRTGMLYFNRMVGYIASLAAVFYGPLIIYNSIFLPTVLVITFNVSSLICLGNFMKKNSSGWLIWAGIFLGLSMITRPNVAIFLFLLVLWLLSKPRTLKDDFALNSEAEQSGVQSHPPEVRAIGIKNQSRGMGTASPESGIWRTGVGRALLLLLPAALVVLPVAGFNYLRSGEFIPVTASGGWVFYCSNNERVKGFDFSPPPELNKQVSAYYAQPEAAELSYLEHLLSREIAEQRDGSSLSHQEGSSFWFNEGVIFIRAHSGSYLKLLGKKLLASINGYEPHDVPEVIVRATVLRPYLLIGSALLFPIALLGLIIVRPRTGGTILYLYLISYLISFLLMYVIPRFRMAVVPVLLLFAAAAVKRLYDDTRGKQLMAVTRNVIILIFLAILVNISTPDIKRDREIVRPAFIHEWKGLTYMKRGEWKKSREEFRKALELNPRSYQAQLNLGLIRERKVPKVP